MPEETLTAAFWNERYLQGTTRWDRGQPSPALLRWAGQGQLPAPGAQVLVPGCGRGHEALWLAQEGYRVTAVDMADAAVAALRARVEEQGLDARVAVVQADLLHWSPSERFDAIYEQTCLCALEPRLWKAYTAALADWLRPGGVLLALFMQTGRDGGPPFHCGLDEMQQLFDAQRWDWLEAPWEQPHPNGWVEYACRLRRRADPEGAP